MPVMRVNLKQDSPPNSPAVRNYPGSVSRLSRIVNAITHLHIIAVLTILTLSTVLSCSGISRRWESNFSGDNAYLVTRWIRKEFQTNRIIPWEKNGLDEIANCNGQIGDNSFSVHPDQDGYLILALSRKSLLERASSPIALYINCNSSSASIHNLVYFINTPITAGNIYILPEATFSMESSAVVVRTIHADGPVYNKMIRIIKEKTKSELPVVTVTPDQIYY